MPTVLIGDAGSASLGGLTQALVNLPIGLEGDGTAPADMAKAMINAAKEGLPFCEQCSKAQIG
jgi:hypothetical protein